MGPIAGEDIAVATAGTAAAGMGGRRGTMGCRAPSWDAEHPPRGLVVAPALSGGFLVSRIEKATTPDAALHGARIRPQPLIGDKQRGKVAAEPGQGSGRIGRRPRASSRPVASSCSWGHHHPAGPPSPGGTGAQTAPAPNTIHLQKNKIRVKTVLPPRALSGAELEMLLTMESGLWFRLPRAQRPEASAFTC